MKLFPDTSAYPEKRLFALDLMRGLDMFCLGYLLHCGWAVQKMWKMPDAFLWNFEHYWGHLGLMDFLQPIFLFVCGAAVPFAIPKRLTPDGRPTPAYWRHVIWRVVMLWGLGLLMHGNFLTFEPSKFLIYNNTLQTIAVGYLAAALSMLIRRNGLLWRAILAFVFVSAAALAVTIYGDYTNTGNISRIIDERIYAYLAHHTPLTGLKGKDFWITEWRDRSDEDVPSHTRYRETLTKMGYMLMMLAQPDVACMNLHEFRCQTGTLAWSYPDGKNKTGNWSVQWMDGAGDRPDFDSIGESRVYVGSMGPAMQNVVESLRRIPVVLDFGSDNRGAYSEGCSNAVYACSDYYGSVLDYRFALRQGKTGEELPRINGDCSYLITRDAGKGKLCFFAVNTKGEDVSFDLEFPELWNAGSPEYRVETCPEKYLDAHEIAGHRLAETYAYSPYRFYPYGRPYRITIPANSVTTVWIPVHKTWNGNRAQQMVRETLTLEQPPVNRPLHGEDQSPDDFYYLDTFGLLSLRIGAKLTVTENGRKSVDTTIGRFRDEKDVWTFAIKKDKLEINLVCDKIEKSAFDALCARLCQFYGVDPEAGSTRK